MITLYGRADGQSSLLLFSKVLILDFPGVVLILILFQKVHGFQGHKHVPPISVTEVWTESSSVACENLAWLPCRMTKLAENLRPGSLARFGWAIPPSTLGV